MADMTCPKCDTTLISVERKSSVSVTGIISAVVFFAGILALLINPIFGIVLIIGALVIGFTQGKQTWLMCPKCKVDVVKLS